MAAILSWLNPLGSPLYWPPSAGTVVQQDTVISTADIDLPRFAGRKSGVRRVGPTDACLLGCQLLFFPFVPALSPSLLTPGRFRHSSDVPFPKSLL